MLPFRFHPHSTAKERSIGTDRLSVFMLPENRSMRRYRTYVLMVLVLVGLYLLATGSKGSSLSSPGTLYGSLSHSSSTALPTSSLIVTKEHAPISSGAGAGAAIGTKATMPSGTCLNPLDPSCWTQQLAQWAAGQIMSAIQPIIDAFNTSSLNILTQTPPADTYQNATVITWWSAFLQVVDLALASIIVLGGYNVMVGRHIGMAHSELSEFLPRVMLAVFAAHFSLYFIGLFLDLENALCSVATNLAGASMLTNTITAIFQGNVIGAGLLVWVLALVVGVMDILLGVQMTVRLALILVLIALAGPGLACFALPQTLRFGRLWLSLFATTVMVQLFQVVALALGGVLITSLGTGGLLNLDSTLVTLFVSMAVLYLVLRLPGMLNTWALRPMMEASRSVTDTAQSTAATATRLLALL